MHYKSKSTVSMFWLILITVGIVVGVVILLIAYPFFKELSTEGDTYHTIACYADNSLASYSLLRDVGFHLPKILCKPVRVDIDASKCDCNDFTAYLSTKHPINYSYDKDTDTYASLLTTKGKLELEYTVKEWDVNLTSFKFYTDPNIQPSKIKVTLQTKGNNFWNRWKTCDSKTITILSRGYSEILDTSCELSSKGKLRIILDTLDEHIHELNVPEINMTFESNGAVLNNAIDLPPKADEAKVKYSYLCKQDMVNGKCSDEWKKEWVALKLGKLAANCWKMGLEGKRQPGAFPCYGGKIKNLPGSVANSPESTIDNISKSMEKAMISKEQTYREYLPKSKLSSRCPNFIPYVRSPQEFTSWLIPALANKNIRHGYRNNDYYSIVYSDLHVLSVLWGIQNLPLSDKVVFC